VPGAQRYLRCELVELRGTWMRILVADGAGVALAAQQLRAGGIVGIPTETVYGLAALTRDPTAVIRVFEAKGRPRFDPLIVHVPAGDPERVLEGVAAFPRDWSRRAELRVHTLLGWWPGPLTLVLPRDPSIPDVVAAGLPTVAVRMPAHPVAQQLLEAVGSPLVAPSANRFGRVSPTTAEAVAEELGDVVEYVLDGGPCAVGVESTVVEVTPDGDVRLLRPGAVPAEVLEAAIGGPLLRATGAVIAPGQLPSHYAPGVPLLAVEGPVEQVPDDLLATLPLSGVVLLKVCGPVAPASAALAARGVSLTEARTLSERGRLDEAAYGLFAALRELDRADVTCVLAELPPTEDGLGAAIADRLRRAARPRPALDAREGAGNANPPAEGA
jgi:L-threonylcarbamoyladenylate synthase